MDGWYRGKTGAGGHGDCSPTNAELRFLAFVDKVLGHSTQNPEIESILRYLYELSLKNHSGVLE